MNDSDAVILRRAGTGETNRLSTEANHPGVRCEHPRQHIHERGLAGAIFPEEGEQATGADPESDIVERAHARKSFRDADGFQQARSVLAAHGFTSALTGMKLSAGSPTGS